MVEKIEVSDFLDFKYLSNVCYAPDGKHCAFIRSVCQEATNTYTSTLEVYDGGSSKQLLTFVKDTTFVWEDNEHLIVLNMSDDKDDETKIEAEKTDFYRVSIHEGIVRKLFTLPYNVSSFKVIHKDQYVFCADYHIYYSEYNTREEKLKAARLLEKQENQDYEILDELPFYGNGQGFTNKIRHTLFTYDTRTSEITRISEKFCDVENYELSETQDIIYYVGESYRQKPTYIENIYAYDRNEKKNEVVWDANTYSIAKIQPWNQKLLVLASDQKRYGLNENKQFYMLDIKTKEMHLFKAYEEAIGSSVGSDVRYGGGRSTKLYQDKFYFITTLFNRSVLMALDTQANISKVYDQEGSVDCFDIRNGKLTFVGLQQMHLQELYTYSLTSAELTQCSQYNQAYYEQKDIRPCKPCNYESDGMTLYGWVLEPSNFDCNKTYPAILDIHGGPKTVYGEVYYHEMQVWANKGYFVFFTNPRGGDGRGNSFADIRGKYGTIDYEDLMRFTDNVLVQYPMIDKKRLGVTGGSYGGFMTNWIIGHTNRFCAAATQRSIANWIGFAYTSDIGEIFANDQQDGNIWDDHDKLWWHSPLKYAKNVTTPTLFIHSNEDYRCPLSEGLQMYSALVASGVEARLCMFKGENHELSRSGKPKHRLKRLLEITNWMEHYLINK